VNSANQAITTPSGWALLVDQSTSSPSQFRFTVWWKPAGPGETSVSLGIHTNANGASASITRYSRPSGTATPPTLAALNPAEGTTGTQPTITPSPDIATDQPNATVISLVANRANNALSLTNPNGFQLDTAISQSSGQPTTIGIASQTVRSPGSPTNSPTWSQNGAPAQWAWATVAFT